MNIYSSKQTNKWKPELTYNEIQALMVHFGGVGAFRTFVTERCRTSPTSITGVTWKTTRLAFSIGMHEVTMRVRIPAELHRQEVFTKPYSILIQLPLHPDVMDSWTNEPWLWHVGTEAMFKQWLNDCL